MGVTQGGPRDLLKPDLDAGRCLVHVQRPTRGPEKRQLRHGRSGGSKSYVSRLERIVESFASTRDEVNIWQQNYSSRDIPSLLETEGPI